MRRLPATLLALSMIASAAAHAEERDTLGFGIILTNDVYGDGSERQRTGALQTSYIWGSAWQSSVPAQFGNILEMRVGLESRSPDYLQRPADDGRRYAGSTTHCAHTHFQHGAVEMAQGADLVFTGSDTGLVKLPQVVHEICGDPKPSEATLDHQSGNDMHPAFVFGVGPNLHWGESYPPRSFAEESTGSETLVQAGFDHTFGRLGIGRLQGRDTATGHRYRNIDNSAEEGVSFLLGAAVAQVANSIYVPERRGLDLTGSRDRIRAGVHWQGDAASAFFGMTWPGPEFESPSEEQITGSVRVNFRF